MCHQSVSLAARDLEANGIATVIIGSAMDIVTWCGVPRYLHNELPLGNPLGPPGDRAAQRDSIERALAMVESMSEPGTEVSDLRWPGDENWQPVYARVDGSNRQTLLKMGEENRKRRAADKAAGLVR